MGDRAVTEPIGLNVQPMGVIASTAEADRRIGVEILDRLVGRDHRLSFLLDAAHKISADGGIQNDCSRRKHACSKKADESAQLIPLPPRR
jgi:hypothetical protein